MTTPNQQAANLDKILERVQKLMALADHPNTPPAEADSARAKAEAMMLEYRITETMISGLGWSAGQGGVAPVWRKVKLCRAGGEFTQTYRYLWANCIAHVDGKSGSRVEEHDGELWVVAECVGYESDLRYAEVLYTSFALAFGGKMEPKYNPALSDQENAYNMRAAGMEGRRIAMAIYGRDDKPLRVKVRNMFRAEAHKRGEDVEGLSGRQANVKTFRKSYADGFENEMYYRLQRMRLSTGDSGAVVLKSRKDNILEEWYNKYPNLRPNPNAGAPRQIGGRDSCAKCAKAASGYCREHQYLKPSTARYVPRAHSQAGYARGQVAAQSVDLSTGSKGRVGNSAPKAVE